MNRRTFVAGSGLVALSGTSLAGCLSVLGGDDGDGGEDYDVISKWLVAPSVVDQDHYQASSMSPARLNAESESLPEGMVAELEQLDEDLDERSTDSIALADVEHLITVRFGLLSGISILLGEIDGDSVVSKLEDDGAEHTQTHEGVELYEDESSVYGISDGVMLQVFGGDSLETARSVIDAEVGAEDRYSDENDAVAAVVDELHVGPATFVESTERIEQTDVENAELAGSVARGNTVLVDGDETTQTIVFAFEDADDVDETDVEELVADSDQLAHFEDVDYDVDGTRLVIEGTGSTEDVFSGGDDEAVDDVGEDDQMHLSAGR